MKCVDPQRVRGEKFVFSLGVSATFVPVGRRGVFDLQFLLTWFANTFMFTEPSARRMELCSL